MKHVSKLKIKIYADGADQKDMLELQQNPIVKGFTTNPTLMYKAGVIHYETFARNILSIIKDKPISFEVLSDDFAEMQRQALKIASWGENVYVKIPIVNSKGESSIPLIKTLAQAGVKQNITAIMTVDQVAVATEALTESQSAIISVFAGRIADTGRDPAPIMREALRMMQPFPQLELLWASSRELFNIFQADEIGCHIITVAHDFFKKMDLFGKDLQDFTLETVKTFYEDAMKAGLSLVD